MTSEEMECHITRFNPPNQKWLDAILSLRAEFDHLGLPETFIKFVMPRLEDETMLLILAWIDRTSAGYGLAFDVLEHPFMPEWTRAGYITPIFGALYGRCDIVEVGQLV